MADLDRHYQSCQRHRKNRPSAKLLRRLLANFGIVDRSRSSHDWGLPHTADYGNNETAEERRLQKLVLMGRMPQDDAQTVVEDLDFTKPWNNKAEFSATVAALAALHKADCDVSTTQKKATQSGTCFRRCAPTII